MVFEKTFYVPQVAEVLQELGLTDVAPNHIKLINAYFKGIISLEPEEDYEALITKIKEILKLDDYLNASEISQAFLRHKQAIQQHHDNNYALYSAGQWGEFLMPFVDANWTHQNVKEIKNLVLENNDFDTFIKSLPEELREGLREYISNEDNFFKLKQLLMQDMNAKELENEKQKIEKVLKQGLSILKKVAKEQHSLKTIPELTTAQFITPWISQNRLYLIDYFKKDLETATLENEVEKQFQLLDAQIKGLGVLYREKATKELFETLKKDLLKQLSKFQEIKENYLQRKKTFTDYIEILYESSQKVPVLNSNRLSIENINKKSFFSKPETELGSPPQDEAFSLIDGPKKGQIWEFKVDCTETSMTKPYSGQFSYDPQGYQSYSKLIDRNPVRFNHGIFRVTQFPSADLGSDSQKLAACIFSLTLVAQALAIRNSFPSAKAPLMIKGHKKGEVQALYAAALALGVKPEAMHVISSYNPKSEKTWYGSFSSDSLYKSVFLKNPHLIEEFRAVAKITPEQEQLKKGVQHFKEQLVMKQKKEEELKQQQDPSFQMPRGS